MRKTLIAIALLTLGCTEASQKVETQKEETVEAAYADTSMRQAPDTYSVAPKQTEDSGARTALSGSKAEYANQRFKEVTIEKLGAGKFRISGKGQIFEASFGWVVEDGHNELKKGHEMTDAGAPEWGNFKFTIDIEKERPNSKLHIILFETSAKDGSRQHELPIPLP